jgi:mono/diheme cytochrome c family protein
MMTIHHRPNLSAFKVLTPILALAWFMTGMTAELPKDSVVPSVRYEVNCPASATVAENCEVGRATYVGWRAFHTHCFQCHGGSALGSTFAPNLLDRFNQHVDYGRFHYVLFHGYTGHVGAMPSFAKNIAVIKDLDALYAYLSARADCVLPAGRPKLKVGN